MVKKRKSQARRGAIEFSITTIIVVVLGVVIIGLGLGFVSGLFSDLGGITKGINENVQGKIDDLGGGVTFSLPQKISVKEGESTVVYAKIGNDGTYGGEVTFNVQIAQAQGNEQSSVTATLAESSKAIAVGKVYTFPIIVNAKKGALAELGASGKVPAFVVSATANGRAHNSGAFVVTLEAPTGLFG